MNWDIIVDSFTHGNLMPEYRVEKSDQEWKAILTPKRYYITRQKGTELPFTGYLYKNFDDGIYNCSNCNEPLFDSFGKFNSGSGWPCFSKPIKPRAIKFLKDKSHGMLRIETLCNVCDAHLGHVFPDGPKPTGLRFCINSHAISLQKISSVKNNEKL